MRGRSPSGVCGTYPVCRIVGPAAFDVSWNTFVCSFNTHTPASSKWDRGCVNEDALGGGLVAEVAAGVSPPILTAASITLILTVTPTTPSTF